MEPDEFAAMRALSMRAFGDDEQIGRLLDALRDSWAWDDELSFVAERGGELVGHVLYSHAFLDAPPRLQNVLVLSPIGVRPDRQRKGIGGALIEASLAEIARGEEPLVFLEGHPAYYPRFGFLRGAEMGFTSPSVRIPPGSFFVYPMPRYEPWMTGALVYSDAFWRTDSAGLRELHVERRRERGGAFEGE
jgi:putative acetyltransferase